MADKGGFRHLQLRRCVEAKGFNAHDGTGFSLARLGGLKAAIITKRISETVALRARDLRIEHVYQGQQDKAAAFYEILSERRSASRRSRLRRRRHYRPAGDAAVWIGHRREEFARRSLRESHYVTPHEGGKGAVRDAIEYILRAQGSLQRVIDDYIYSRSQDPSTKVQ